MLAVKNLPSNARDLRDWGLILGREDPLEEEMATHSSILARGIHDREPWRATVHGVTKSQKRLQQLTIHKHMFTIIIDTKIIKLRHAKK